MMQQDQGENNPGIQLSWDNKWTHYGCRDGKCIAIVHRSASVRNLDETRTVPRNVITYMVSKKEPRTCASGVEFSRDMKKVFGGPDDVRTVIFPEMVRTIRQGSFRGVKSLKSAVLNEGLEVLGTEEDSLD